MESSFLAQDELHLNKTRNSTFVKNINNILKIYNIVLSMLEQVNGAYDRNGIRTRN